jgi:hypothetical protein
MIDLREVGEMIGEYLIADKVVLALVDEAIREAIKDGYVMSTVTNGLIAGYVIQSVRYGLQRRVA